MKVSDNIIVKQLNNLLFSLRNLNYIYLCTEKNTKCSIYLLSCIFSYKRTYFLRITYLKYSKSY